MKAARRGLQPRPRASPRGRPPPEKTTAESAMGLVHLIRTKTQRLNQGQTNRLPFRPQTLADQASPFLQKE